MRNRFKDYSQNRGQRHGMSRKQAKKGKVNLDIQCQPNRRFRRRVVRIQGRIFLSNNRVSVFFKLKRDTASNLKVG
jgi:hypothetical protein